jgi:hypothetical protein
MKLNRSINVRCTRRNFPPHREHFFFTNIVISQFASKAKEG